MQKNYQKPAIKVSSMSAENVMQTASRLDQTMDTQSITISNEEYDGEFSARQTKSVWDD